MDTCFPLLQLKHHRVKSTGERNQPIAKVVEKTDGQEERTCGSEGPLPAHGDENERKATAGSRAVVRKTKRGTTPSLHNPFPTSHSNLTPLSERMTSYPEDLAL